MKYHNPNDRIRIYKPLYKFLSVLKDDIEYEIEEGKHDFIILDSPSNQTKKSILEAIPCPIERFIIIALTAKKMVEENEVDERNILFSLSKVPYYLFPEFNEENAELYSQAEVEEAEEFLNNFLKILPQYTPRFDNNISIILKLEYYINSYLYFAYSMNESRFPYGSDFYDFLSFIIHEFYTILKPQEDFPEKELYLLCSTLKTYIDYRVILYIFDHYPEQASELTFILNNIKNLPLSKSEKELLHEYLSDTILVNKKDKQKLLFSLT